MSGVKKRRTRRSIGARKSKQPPKTKPRVSRLSDTRDGPRIWKRATTDMKLTELQYMAKSLGLPFGGLDKSRLVKRINEVR